jgi:hypothetical protein
MSGLKYRRCCKSELAHRRNLGIDPAFGPVICGAVERRDVSEAAAGSDNEPGLVADGDLEQTWKCLEEAAGIPVVTVWKELRAETMDPVDAAKASIQILVGAEPDREVG